MKPPRGGPISGPISAGVVSQAIRSTISCFGALRSTTSRPTGVIIAPPSPCRTRASTNPSSELDSPQAIEPAVKTAMALANTVRAPKRSAAQPLTGMKTARLRR